MAKRKRSTSENKSHGPQLVEKTFSLKRPDGTWRKVTEEEFHEELDHGREEEHAAFVEAVNRPVRSLTPKTWTPPSADVLTKALGWLQSLALDRTNHRMPERVYTAAGEVKPTEPSIYLKQESFHGFLVSIGAPVVAVTAECKKRGWLNDIQRWGPGSTGDWFYNVNMAVLSAQVEPTKSRPTGKRTEKPSATDQERYSFAKPLREKRPKPVTWASIAQLYNKQTGEPVDQQTMKQSWYRVEKWKEQRNEA